MYEHDLNHELKEVNFVKCYGVPRPCSWLSSPIGSTGRFKLPLRG